MCLANIKHESEYRNLKNEVKKSFKDNQTKSTSVCCPGHSCVQFAKIVLCFMLHWNLKQCNRNMKTRNLRFTSKYKATFHAYWKWISTMIRNHGMNISAHSKTHLQEKAGNLELWCLWNNANFYCFSKTDWKEQVVAPACARAEIEALAAVPFALIKKKKRVRCLWCFSFDSMKFTGESNALFIGAAESTAGIGLAGAASQALVNTAVVSLDLLLRLLELSTI